MSTRNSSSTAATGLDLDTLERDGVVPEPFTFTLDGKTWTATDPAEIEWHIVEALNVDSPTAVIEAYLGTGQFAEFDQVKLPAWKIRRLIRAINDHYVPGESLGETEGLPTS